MITGKFCQNLDIELVRSKLNNPAIGTHLMSGSKKLLLWDIYVYSLSYLIKIQILQPNQPILSQISQNKIKLYILQKLFIFLYKKF